MKRNKMKTRRWRESLFYSAVGFYLAIGLKFLMCPILNEETPMMCWESAKLETLTGVVFLLIGFLSHHLKSGDKRRKLHCIAIVSAIAAMLIAACCGSCHNPEMLCNNAGIPSVYAVSLLSVYFSLFAIMEETRAVKTGLLQKNPGQQL